MFLQKQIFMVSDECTLLKQFKSGEREAFDRLFKMYAPQLGYFCLRLVRQEDAEEIVQETFIKLWETRDERAEKLTITEVTEKYELTKREHTILQLLMQGKDNHTICEELSISVNTLKKHILNIYRKLGIRNRVQMFKMIKEKE